MLFYAVLSMATIATIIGAYYAGTKITSEPQNTGISAPENSRDESIPADASKRIDAAVKQASAASATMTVDDRLRYLIEEEKLAHDVYQKMYDIYGVRTFSNIARSETTHQNLVLVELKDRGITDPRSMQPGEFENADLQKLYDSLIARGSANLSQAYQVGVTIEEVDIADLTAGLQAVDPSETSVITMMETLKHGSENHLRAFSRHV